MSPRDSAVISSAPEGSAAGAAEAPDKETVGISNGSAGSINAAEEYVRIRANRDNKEPLDITGWTLKNRNGERLAIGGGAILPYSAQVNRQENIMLAPDDEAVIITGKSPIGASFRLNLCTGYFNQFQKFTPSLPKDCPAANKTPELYDMYDDACIATVEKQPRCTTLVSVPFGSSNACGEYLNRHLNYNGCVDDYKNDKNFFSPKKWYVYLGRDSEFWPGTRGTIKLFDRDGNLAAETTY